MGDGDGSSVMAVRLGLGVWDGRPRGVIPPGEDTLPGLPSGRNASFGPIGNAIRSNSTSEEYGDCWGSSEGCTKALAWGGSWLCTSGLLWLPSLSTSSGYDRVWVASLGWGESWLSLMNGVGVYSE